MKDHLRYDRMVEAALRGVVREALARVAANGRPGAHHFYITFRTRAPGVRLPDYLAMQYPEEMTIVLENQFWDLSVTETHFSVTLSFQKQLEQLVIPFDAVTAFADPAVKFGLQFQAAEGEAQAPVEAAPPSRCAEKAEGPAEIVALDKFRKK